MRTKSDNDNRMGTKPGVKQPKPKRKLPKSDQPRQLLLLHRELDVAFLMCQTCRVVEVDQPGCTRMHTLLRIFDPMSLPKSTLLTGFIRTSAGPWSHGSIRKPVIFRRSTLHLVAIANVLVTTINNADKGQHGSKLHSTYDTLGNTLAMHLKVQPATSIIVSNKSMDSSRNLMTKHEHLERMQDKS